MSHPLLFPLTDAEQAIVVEVLARYALPAPAFAPLPRWYAYHLRVKVDAADGQSYQLRERPRHLTLDAWRFHHQIQPTAPIGVPVPLLQLTRDGEPFVAVGDRHFEVISWLDGESRGLTEEADFAAAGEGLAGLHNHLRAAAPALPIRRTVATTNNIAMWTGSLLAENPGVTFLPPFTERVAALLERLPADPLVSVHGDTHPYNLIWQQDRLSGICDWEDAHLNVPTFDLAYLIAHSTFIDWPCRQPAGGREAFVRDQVHDDHTRALLSGYRRRLDHAIPTAGFARALVQAWMVTMRTTVLRGSVDEPTVALGRQRLEWIADPANLRPWQELLDG